MNYEQIKTAAEGYKADMAKFLRDMIRIPSESCEEEGRKGTLQRFPRKGSD